MGHWFHGDSGAHPDLIADAEAFGMTLPDSIHERTTFAVWPECWDVVMLFLRICTQWRTGPSGVVGLDYGVALQVAEMSGITDRLSLLDDLQVMEYHARGLINKQAGAT